MRTGKYIDDMHKSTEETQSIKRMMRFVVMMLLMMCFGVGDVWADGITVLVEKSDGSYATITGTGGSVDTGITGGKVSVAIDSRNVTLTVTPDDGYRINKDLIMVEKMVNPTDRSNAPRRAPGTARFDVTGPGSTDEERNGWKVGDGTTGYNYTFSVATEYDGAYVITKFLPISSTVTQITSLSEISNNLAGNYELVGDIDASGISLGEFTGTLDGKNFTIHHLSHPLFASTNDAIIHNINFENINISTDGDAGAITSCAKGATRIYNCGILPTTTEYDAEGNVIGFLGSSVSGTGNVGGLVGKLEGTARVINCFSYANITGGTNKGGIVGNNTVTTTASSVNTMVMNCMFYGDISNGNNISPIYGGTLIGNLKTNSTTGLNTYNYYRYESDYSYDGKITNYNNALAAKEEYLNRFEFYRQMLNSNKKLAAYYASTTTVTVNPNDMEKWVLETADKSNENPYPYPVLKPQGKYSSIINYDTDHVTQLTLVNNQPREEDRNKGEKIGTLDVTIKAPNDWTNAPSGAKLLDQNGNEIANTETTRTIPLVRTDKDTLRYNFNYDKVQLPYYNDYGTKNYTDNKVVTGWKIMSVTIGTGDDVATQGTFTASDSWGGYNFADRKTYAKDLYSGSETTDHSGRVFSQGAYFDVPYGATAITIEPYWGNAAYISDENLDVVYTNKYDTPTNVLDAQYTFSEGKAESAFNSQDVYSDISTALGTLNGSTVYDNALVLVGNRHLSTVPSDDSKAFTMMSVDMDHDNEPDYSLIYHHDSRLAVSPIRFDFLNVIGTAQAQKPRNADNNKFYNVGIFIPKGWFEVTNTTLMYFSQIEYDNGGGKAAAPLILLGGIYDQITSNHQPQPSRTTTYIHVGSNARFKQFSNGCHNDRWDFTRHIPISVTGGDYQEFYLSGMYRPNAVVNADDAECYISGGRFGEVAGAGQQMINGNVQWQIYNADIDNFYGGGINAAYPITGNITVNLYNSHIGIYCGGPKFGNMQKAGTPLKYIYSGGNNGNTPTTGTINITGTDRIVTTQATGCTFGTYYGAGFGGTSYNTVRTRDSRDVPATFWEGDYTSARGKYSSTNNGIATDFDYDFFVWSSGETGGRFYVKYASLSTAQTNNVTSILTNCTVNGNVYGGGKLGRVDGKATTTLNGCTVNGDVFGAGYSGTLEPIKIRVLGFNEKYPSVNTNSGMFEDGEFSETTDYIWKEHALTNGALNITTEDGVNYIYTDVHLNELGHVNDSELLIQGNTTAITGNVYGGGEEANVNNNTAISMSGGTVSGNVFGGGKGSDENYECDKAMVGVNNAGAGANPADVANIDKGTKVIITGGAVNGNVYGGGEVSRVEWNTQVTIGTAGDTNESARPVISGSVFGAGAGVETHGYSALVRGNSTVTVQGKAKVLQNVYGGGENATVGRYWVKGINNNVDGAPPAPTNLPIGMPYQQQSGGICTVTIQDNAQVGPDNGGIKTAGHVFGAGKGILPQFNAETSKKMTKDDGLVTFTADANHATAEDAYLEFLQTLALVTYSNVTIDGSAIVKGSVYGGSESGYVQHDTKVTVSGGTIGTPKNGNNVYGGAFFGNVYGGGKGDAEYTGTNNNYLVAGIVKGSTEVKIEDGTILHNIYGGGAYGTVGVFDYGNDGLPTGLNANAPTNSGKTKIEITGGEIGTDGSENGMIFGSSRGDVGAEGSIHDKLAWVYDTEVKIGTSGSTTGPQINGSIYGGGENGHVFNDADVYIYSGTVGIETGSSETNIVVPDPDDPDDESKATTYEGAEYPYRGNVYGGGCGTDMYWIDTDNDNKVDDGEEHFNSLAGIVYGDATVTMTGGKIVHNVYGAGAMGSVGKATTTNDVTTITGGTTTINISGGTIGVDGTYGEGNVFGAARGSADATSNEYALVRKETSVSITGGEIKGNVYGGGELGCVGVYTMSTDMRTFTWQDTDGTTNTAANAKNTGMCNVTVDGSSAVINGNVFGAGKGKDDTFWCEKGIAYSTNVSIKNGTVNRNVYGGGEVGRVETDTKVKIGNGAGTANGTPAPTIEGSVFGGGAGVETHGYSALVRGNTTVTLEGNASVAHSVYGGGEIASVGKYGLDAQKMPSILQGGGYCYVTIKGYATVAEDVFGAGKGVTPHFDNTNVDYSKRSRRMTLKNDWESLEGAARFDWDYLTENNYSTYLETLALATHPEVIIDGNTSIGGSVFGGGELGLTKGSVVVNILGGTIAEDVYGGGSLANTNTTSTVDLDGDGKTETVHPTTVVNLLGGTIGGNAYGGGLGRLAHGAVAAVYTAVESGTTLTAGKKYYTSNAGADEFEATGNEDTSTTTYYELTTPASDAVTAVEAFVYGDIKVNLNGLEKDDYIESIHSNYVHAVGSPATEYALKTTTSGEGANAVTTYPKGAIVNQIFGCNNLNGSPKKHVKVHVFATQSPDASHNRLNLKYPKRPVQGENDTENSKETSKQYLQRLINATHVDGDTNKDLLPEITENVINAAQTTCSINSATETEINTAITAVQQELCKLYDVKAVYGGGNLAAYVPADPNPDTDWNDTEERTEVIIDGCDLTSIETVYGGGNAASVPASKVRVNGTYEIEELFGGGNGKDLNTINGEVYQNPGANVGYYNYTHYVKKNETGYNATNDGAGTSASPYIAHQNTTDAQGGDASTVDARKANYKYGDGITTIEVRGGLIHEAYGGSNTKGNIREKTESTYEDAEICPMQIDESYGGGKNSPMDAEVAVNLDCVKNMDMIFGGSKNADVNNNITLNITNGTFQKVFGGNNTSGAINGAITVNIEEKGCQPIRIDELYLGGYLAPYSVYGYNNDKSPKTSGTQLYNDPRLNVISATSIGDIFGGGYQAKMVGNPYVNVNMKEGKIEVMKVEVTKTPVSRRDKTNEDAPELVYHDEEDNKDYVYYTEAENVETVYDPAKVEKGNTNYIYKDAASRYYDPTKVATESTKYYVYTDIHNDPHTHTTGDSETTGTLEIGTIGNIYGGGNEADVIGDTHVEIGTGQWVTAWENGYPVYETEYIDTNDENKVKHLYYKEQSHAVYYTAETANAYNADLEGALTTAALTAEQAEAYNSAIHPETPKEKDNTLTPTEVTSYNAKLPGAVRVGDVQTPAVWAWYTYTTENGYVKDENVTTAPTPTRNAAQITGNVFGGGKGVADNFYCNKAMVGIDGAGVDANNNPTGYRDGNTNVTIANGSVGGNVYGGGEIGRVEMNSTVTIGDGDGVASGTPTSAPVIEGSVFGGGKGKETHGYAALVRGNPTVVVQGNAKVRGNVYGGGEIASVARYKVKLDPADPDAPVGWPMGMPYALKNANSGFCTVTIGGYAEIGPEEPMHMVTTSGRPDDAGHVFGAGMGILPKEYTYADDEHKPKRMVLNDDKTASIWEYFANENTYIGFIQTLALASQTEVTIKDHAFVKGSVYGGSFDGIVQYNTHVTIDGDCQIGAGKQTTNRFSDDVWADDYTVPDGTDLECAHWPYGKEIPLYENGQQVYDNNNQPVKTKVYLPFDIYDLDANNKPKAASDGHTFYGNVFGGGSGYYPYRRKNASPALDGVAWTKDIDNTNEVGQPVDANGYSDGVWLNTAGIVRGNTTVDIKGGHILTSAYGGNEQTDVMGSCTVNMSGGTLGVPRTLEQIAAHPVTCYLFGAGKGDQRINFNTWTNVASVNVNITGGKIYGSVFGGGEDGHVLGDVTMNIGQAQDKTTKIGTWGTSYVDGNVFGGGRGFSGEAQTAGTVGGNVTMNITGGEMLGSIYGGGRLASVGTQFTSPEDDNYGNFVEDNEDILYTQEECDAYNATLFGYIAAGTALTAAQAETVNAALETSYEAGQTLLDNDAAEYTKKLYGYKKVGDIRIPAGTYGHITINISGGTIGNDLESIIPTYGENGNIPEGITQTNIKKWTPADWTLWKNHNHIPNTDFELYDSVKVENSYPVEYTYKYHAAHTKGGNVFGGSMGRLQLLNGKTNPIWPKMAQVKTTDVNIYGDAVIKRSVYGGGELGTVRDNVYVTIGGIKNADVNENGIVGINAQGGGTVNWDVFGGGYGSDDDDTKTIFTVKELKENAGDPPYNASDYEEHTYAFTPMQFAGCVGQNTFVHICGGYVKKSVYGGGEMASVGIINCRVDETPGDNKIEAGTKDNTTYYYSNMVKHSSIKSDGAYYDFGLSWPYEFEYVPTFNGATHVHVTGGRIGATTTDDIGTDNGDVYGGGKGIAGDYNDYVFCANVGSAEVHIEYDPNVQTTTLNPATYKTSGDCIAGAVYGGGENGHVMGDTKLTLVNGLIGHSMYGGGSGKGLFPTTLVRIGKDPKSTAAADKYTREIYSITAGKVFGNTELEMTGGYVVRNVYGGGNMGSVGKGNYSGGSDDYSAAGYGELPPKDNQALWTSSTVGDFPWHFLNSGKCKVTITGGTIGYIDESDPSSSMYPWNSTASLPYGNVFGGCRGVSAPNIGESPRYLYCPESFMGFVNETEVTIGTKNDATTGPRIFGSVYGGGMDGHVRRDASVTVNSGEIGLAYNEANREMLKTLISNSTEPHIATSVEDLSDLDNLQWLARGNVYGAGSGIGNYEYDFNYDGDYLDKVDYTNPQTGRSSTVKETDFSTSAGSVTRFTTVTINGGKIHRNVYGGGSLSSVGAPKIPPIPNDPYRKGDTDTEHGEGKQSLNQVNIAGTIGTPEDYQAHYGGEVYGASRGEPSLGTNYSNAVWTEVNLKKGAHVQGNVFGGGDSGPVREDSEVNVGVTFSTDAESTMSITKDGGDKTINVTSNVTWEAKSSASWLTVSQKSGEGDGTITVTATANTGEGAEERTATITITGAGETKTITVTQAGES